MRLADMALGKVAPSLALFFVTNLSGLLSDFASSVLPKTQARKLLNTLGCVGVSAALVARASVPLNLASVPLN